MKITILGTESLGVRGLSCVVQVGDRKIVIDPGVALGYRRHGLLPHPAQVAVGERVQREIMTALQGATDVVFSHFHGDHIPLPDANPYQLSAQKAASLLRTVRIWSRGSEGLSHHMASRRIDLMAILGRDLPNSEGQRDGSLQFSLPVPHGDSNTRYGKVMMTRIEDEDGVFVHASDIQLLNSEAVDLILGWRPNIVLVDGPPLYLPYLTTQKQEQAWRNGLRLAHVVDILILDHHLLRCEAGLHWLDSMASETGKRVLCAADFMDYPRCLLEAQRAQLYEEMPVPEGWHEAYANGKADTSSFQVYNDVHERLFLN